LSSDCGSTSIGYGASFGGLAPLLTMLNLRTWCGVVNIDNGFGGILAGQILRTADKLQVLSDVPASEREER